MKTQQRSVTIESPLGHVRITGDADVITEVYLGADRAAPNHVAAPYDAVLGQGAAQLQAYFAGERTAFDLPLGARGTPFQCAVWTALAEIPFGETATYAQIAARIGAPTAARAVGMANARNPIAIVVPCHRVIGASGALTGYAAGIDRKRWLLEHEGSVRGAAT